jgi:aspartate-semialdehyde dehydrogenase
LIQDLRVAIVGAETMLGRELQSQLGDAGANLSLTGTSSGISAVLGEEDDEATAIILNSLDAEIEAVDVVLLADRGATAQQALEIWRESEQRPLLLDLVGELEDQPEARLGVPGLAVERGGLYVVPHAAALIVYQLLSRIGSGKLRQSVIHVFEPASERGQEGVNELHQQTTSLLNFKSLEKRVFDTQAAFSMLVRYGAEAPVKLEDVEQRIDRHLASLFGTPPLPSLRLLQAPVFHAYALSFWLEFEKPMPKEDLVEALEGSGVEVRGEDLDAPSSSDVISQSGTVVGVVEQDRNNPNAVWLWAVADNFRVVIEQAVTLVETMA